MLSLEEEEEEQDQSQRWKKGEGMVGEGVWGECKACELVGSRGERCDWVSISLACCPGFGGRTL